MNKIPHPKAELFTALAGQHLQPIPNHLHQKPLLHVAGEVDVDGNTPLKGIRDAATTPLRDELGPVAVGASACNARIGKAGRARDAQR